METLPKDIQEKILNELNPGDFVKLYKDNEKSNLIKERIIQDDEIWFRRFHKDYPFLVPHLRRALEKEEESYKDLYLNIFNRIHKANENIYENLVHWCIGEYFLQFLTEEYKKNLFNFFTEYLINLIPYVFENAEEYTADWIFDISGDYYFDDSNKNNVNKLHKILPKIMGDDNYNDLHNVVREHTDNFLIDLFTYLEILSEDSEE